MATNLTQIRIEASLDASGYIAAAQKKAQADQQMVDSGNKVAASLDATDRRLNQNTGVNKFLQSNDQALKVTSLFEHGLRQLRATIEANNISAADAARQLDLITLKYNAGLAAAAKNEAALRSLSNTTGGFTQSIRQNQIAFLELQAAGINAFQSLASGITPFRVAITEGAQVVGALVQGTNPLIRFGSVFGPIGIAAAAAAVAIGSLAVGVTRLTSTQQNIKDFQLTLSALGEDGKASGAALQQAFQQIRDSGTSAADALKAINAIARDPLINQARAAEIITLARDISAVTGEDLPAAQQKLQNALTGGIDSIIKFGQSLNALTADQAAQIRQTGNLDIAVRALQERFSGLFPESLTRTQKGINEVSKAWNGLLDAFSHSPVIEGLVSLFDKLTAAVIKGTEGMLRSGADMLRGGTGILGPSASAQIPSGITSDLERVTQAVIQAESGGNQAAVSSAGAIGKMQLLPSTARELGVNPYNPVENVAGGQKYLLKMVERYGSLELGLIAYNFGPGNLDAALEGQKQIPASTQKYAQGILSNAGLTGRETAAQLGGSANPIAGLPSEAQVDILRQAQEANDRLNVSLKQTGAIADATRAFYEAYNSTQGKSLDQTNRTALAQDAYNQVLNKAGIEFNKETVEAGKLVQGTLNAADAFITSEAAGLRATAAVQATTVVFGKFGESADNAGRILQQTNQILEQQAATAISSGEQQARSFDKTIAANEALAAAAAKGTAAFQAEQIVIQAATETHDALAKAIASGNPALIARAEALQAETEAQLRSNQAALQSTQLNQRAERVGQDVQVTQLETRLELEGKSSAEIANQVSMLRLRLDLEGKDVQANAESKASITAQVEAFGKANIALEEARQRTERWNEEIRNIAETISDAIGSALDDLLSGKKITDWGDRFKKVISEIASQILQAEVIRPLIGSALQGLGASSQVVSQFGTFGQGGGGILSSLFGGGGGPLSSLFGGGQSGGLLSSLFRPATTGLSPFDLAELGVPSEFAATGTAGTAGGLLSGLGGALGGIGLGASAGSLLNSILGGKSTGGTIGSAGGAAAGALIGSIIPGIGTIIGGLIGGLFGGAGGGLIGPKPSTLASGSSINLTSGVAGDFRSSGNAQNDQTVQNISSTLSKFLQQLQQTTGGNIGGGSLNVVATTKGIQTHYSGPLGDISATFSSIDEAIAGIEKAFLQNITGVNDSIKTALAHITDPSQIQAALQAVQVYDAAITTSFGAVTKATTDASTLFSQSSVQISSAFDQVSQQIGPYAKAFDQINSQFMAASAGVTQQREVLLAQATALKQTAQQYGLSLDGIDDAFMKAADTLNETQNSLDNARTAALERLAQNFNQNIEAALRETTDPFGAAVDAELQRAHQRLTEATALGVDLAQVQRYNSQNLDKVLLQASNTLGGTTSRTTASLGALAKSLDALFQSLEQNLQTIQTVINASGVTQLTGSDQFSQVYNQIRTQIAAEIRANLEVQHQNNPAVIPTIETPEIQGLIQQEHDAVHRLALDFNEQIGVLLTGITDPVAAAIQAEKIAGDNRVTIAKTIGADLTQVEAYNAASLQRVTDQATKAAASADAFGDSLKKINDFLGTVGPTFNKIIDQASGQNKTLYQQSLDSITEAYQAAFDTLQGLGASAAQIQDLFTQTDLAVARLNIALAKRANDFLGTVGPSYNQIISSSVGEQKNQYLQALDQIKSAYQAAFDTLTDLGASALQIQDLFTATDIATNRLSAAFAKKINDFLGTVGPTFNQVIDSAAGTNKTSYQQALDSITAAYQSAFDTLQGLGASADRIQDLFTQTDLAVGRLNVAFAQRIGAFLGTINDVLSPSISSVVQDTRGPFKQALDSLLAAYQAAFNTLQDLGASADAIRQLFAATDAAASKITDSFNTSLNRQILAINDPFQAGLDEVLRNGRQRVADAKAIGGDLSAVYVLNSLELQKYLDNAKLAARETVNFTGALASLRDALRGLRTGPLSGLTPAQNVTATIDDFRRERASVLGGNYDELQNFINAGNAAVQASQAAYGNASQTVAIRNEVREGLRAVRDIVKPKAIEEQQLDAAQKANSLAAETLNEQKFQTSLQREIAFNTATGQGAVRGFATGTEYTPPGVIRVGERGPELLYQHGGNTVVPFGKMIAANENAISDVKDLLRAILRQTQAGQGQANKDAKMIAGETAVVGRKLSSYSPPRMRAVS